MIFPPIFIVYPLSLNFPFVKFSDPLAVMAELAINVAEVALLLLMVILFKFRTEAGMLNGPALFPPKLKLEEDVVTNPPLPLIGAPLIESVVLPSDSVSLL